MSIRRIDGSGRASILRADLKEFPHVPPGALAHEYKAGSLEIVHPWARATQPGAQVAGGYVQITNKGSEADTLVGVKSGVAHMAMIHSMSMENGVMKMGEMEGGITIAPGATVVLKPKSLHIMFMGLKEPLMENVMFDAELEFTKAGTVKVEFMVEAPGSEGNHH